jgi:hypothetical protein
MPRFCPTVRGLAAVAALLVSAAAASAGPIVQYDLFGVAGDSPSAPATFVAPDVTALDITRGPGLTPNAASNSINSRGWDDLSPDDYVQLGFTTAVPFDVDRLILATRSSGTGPGFIDVDVSVDGGAFTTVTTLTQPDATFVNSIIDLDLTVTSSLVVRFFAANGTAANGGAIGAAGTFRVGNYFDGTNFFPIELSGSPVVAAVPEPAGLTLAGVGLAAAVGVRRARRRVG